MGTLETAVGRNPEVIAGAVPYLTVDGAVKAAEFYGKAFGAPEVARCTVDETGRTMHIHLHLHGGSVMLSDAYPEHRHPWQQPQGFALHLQVDDVDAWFERAVAAGTETVMAPQEMFWGDRYGQLRDPYGVSWSVGGPPKAG